MKSLFNNLNFYFRIIIVVLFISCNKSNDSITNSNGTITLNTTENLLLGKWTLSTKIDTLYMPGLNQYPTVKSYTKPSVQQSYVEFLSTKFSSNLVPNADSRSKNGFQAYCSFASNQLGQITLGTNTARWYYDDATKLIYWNEEKVTLVKVSSSELICKVMLEDLGLKYKHIITWRFVK